MAEKVVNTSGKHKTAVARAAVKSGTGIVRINKIPLPIYGSYLVNQKISEPVNIAGESVISKLDISVTVSGGGVVGQAYAARTAIAKGIVEFTNDVAVKDAFAEFDRSLLVSDSRQKEPKYFGGPGARARYQKSYR
ncbi:30S ribosomal protein S9 [Methanolapillus millepedarum]|uniref:Small ribosomal subunit protein uS9 n=1 Tax=Methanolapillus millepedarum TaxID=3028296 RepID=A0AA96V4Q1_9EURY|nr:30S ribosomal protein S9 [Methanosarcinaceae archaeon Ac7]